MIETLSKIPKVVTRFQVCLVSLISHIHRLFKKCKDVIDFLNL